MATSKTLVTLVSSQSCGDSSTITGSDTDISSYVDGTLTARIINGSTGPVTACSVRFEVKVGTDTWRPVTPWYEGGVTNGGYWDFTITCPSGFKNIRAVFSGNTGQAVTVEAFFHGLSI